MSTKMLKWSWYWLARFICWLFCVVYFRFRVHGRKNVPENGALILAGNHQSFLDPVFCGIAVKRHLTYVARDSLWRFGPFGRLIGSVNAIPVSRDKADIAAMRMIIDRLRQGEAVCLYPEGTRTLDGRIAPFKPGFGLLCRRSKAAIIPVLVEGGFDCWPRHRKFPSPGAINVWFGEVLPPERVLTMTNEELADTLSRTLRQMQHAARLQQGKKPYAYDDREGPANA
jgi:1-acyl-sn-glycerol-3-phosphate acyltransferase